jgi:ribosomal protein S18 acetylase RimI-like enzyme
MKNTNKIIYSETDEKELDTIAPLWRKLNEHHKVRSKNFKEHFSRMMWEKRKTELLEKSKNGAMLIDLAKDKQSGKYIGYCVSTVDEKNHGELESIFIEEEYRKCGIGGHFIKNSIKWMDSRGAIAKTIAVAAGNEEVFRFYTKYGFYPRVTILMQAEKKPE